MQHLLLADQLNQVVLQGRRGALHAGWIDGIILRRACGPADGSYVGREHLLHLCSLSQRPADPASYQAHETDPIVRALLTMNTVATALYGRRHCWLTVIGKIMPIYQCFSPEGLLGESTRVNLAEEITRIHCDATGIPPSFVNVMFFDLPDGRYFVAGKPSAHSVLNGAIRLGRDLATRQRILRDLSQMWTRLTGQPEEELLVSLWESPAENVMEAGSIFPALGQEQQWLSETTPD